MTVKRIEFEDENYRLQTAQGELLIKRSSVRRVVYRDACPCLIETAKAIYELEKL